MLCLNLAFVQQYEAMLSLMAQHCVWGAVGCGAGMTVQWVSAWLVHRPLAVSNSAQTGISYSIQACTSQPTQPCRQRACARSCAAGTVAAPLTFYCR